MEEWFNKKRSVKSCGFEERQLNSTGYSQIPLAALSEVTFPSRLESAATEKSSKWKICISGTRVAAVLAITCNWMNWNRAYFGSQRRHWWGRTPVASGSLITGVLQIQEHCVTITRTRSNFPFAPITRLCSLFCCFGKTFPKFQFVCGSFESGLPSPGFLVLASAAPLALYFPTHLLPSVCAALLAVSLPGVFSVLLAVSEPALDEQTWPQ